MELIYACIDQDVGLKQPGKVFLLSQEKRECGLGQETKVGNACDDEGGDHSSLANCVSVVVYVWTDQRQCYEHCEPLLNDKTGSVEDRFTKMCTAMCTAINTDAVNPTIVLFCKTNSNQLN